MQIAGICCRLQMLSPKRNRLCVYSGFDATLFLICSIFDAKFQHGSPHDLQMQSIYADLACIDRSF